MKDPFTGAFLLLFALQVSAQEIGQVALSMHWNPLGAHWSKKSALELEKEKADEFLLYVQNREQQGSGQLRLLLDTDAYLSAFVYQPDTFIESEVILPIHIDASKVTTPTKSISFEGSPFSEVPEQRSLPPSTVNSKGDILPRVFSCSNDGPADYIVVLLSTQALPPTILEDLAATEGDLKARLRKTLSQPLIKADTVNVEEGKSLSFSIQKEGVLAVVVQLRHHQREEQLTGTGDGFYAEWVRDYDDMERMSFQKQGIDLMTRKKYQEKSFMKLFSNLSTSTYLLGYNPPSADGFFPAKVELYFYDNLPKKEEGGTKSVVSIFSPFNTLNTDGVVEMPSALWESDGRRKPQFLKIEPDTKTTDLVLLLKNSAFVQDIPAALQDAEGDLEERLKTVLGEAMVTIQEVEVRCKTDGWVELPGLKDLAEDKVLLLILKVRHE